MNSDKFNFSKADEWYKFPIYDDKLEDEWSNKLNAAKRQKCSNFDHAEVLREDTLENETVFSTDDGTGDLNISIMPSPITADTSYEDE